MISVFEPNEKLNKVDGNIYTIEEKVVPKDGVYEDYLKHDNINEKTLYVYSGSRLTGERITDYALSTPSLMPWKRQIRIYSDLPAVYISYETDGDTVEAEDVNILGTEVQRTQAALNAEETRAKAAEKVLDQKIDAETARAKAAEQTLDQKINAETDRAKKAEQVLDQKIDAETTRAKAAEKKNADAIVAETKRAETAETNLNTALNAEISRAKAAEKANAEAIVAETKSRTDADIALGKRIDAEIKARTNADSALGARIDAEAKTRADADIALKAAVDREVADRIAAVKSEADARIAADNGLQSNIDKEATRAKAAEKANADAITAEKSRAQAAENAIQSTINTNKPKWDDKYTKAEVDNKLSALETKIDWKESVATFADIAKTYPSPEDGWTVNVKDTDYTYRYSGSAWVVISANAIPKATTSVDGLLTHEDKTKYDDAYTKRHTHDNKSVIDKITQALLDNWSAAYAHISSKSNPHAVTKAQVGLGNVPNVATNDQTPTFTQATVLAALTSGEKLSVALGKIAKAVADFIAHKADKVIHITAAERTSWSDTASKAHTHSNKAVLDKLTQAMLDKLAGIADGATKYVHPNSGVKAGTYKSVTVNEQGHVTAGTNPTTLAGYGITDAAAKNHTHSYLPLSGGTVTGGTILQQGYYVFSSAGEQGKAGYVHIAQIKIGGNYTNVPISFELTNRNAGMSMYLFVQFASGNTFDPSLSKFTYFGSNLGAYIIKSATSTWDLYVKKSEACDEVAVIAFHKPVYMHLVSVTWKGGLVTSVPSGYAQATLALVSSWAAGANRADVLTKARKITLGGLASGSASFNGSGDIVINDYGNYGIQNIGNDISKPYARIAYSTTATISYRDYSCVLLMQQPFNGGAWGILKLSLRSNDMGASVESYGGASAKWLVRAGGFYCDQFIVKGYQEKGTVYADLYYKAEAIYSDLIITMLASGGRDGVDTHWHLNTQSQELRAAMDIRTYNFTNTSTDEGYVATAESANSVAWGNVSGKPSTYPPASHNHDDVYLKKKGITWGALKGN